MYQQGRSMTILVPTAARSAEWVRPGRSARRATRYSSTDSPRFRSRVSNSAPAGTGRV